MQLSIDVWWKDYCIWSSSDVSSRLFKHAVVWINTMIEQDNIVIKWGDAPVTVLNDQKSYICRYRRQHIIICCEWPNDNSLKSLLHFPVLVSVQLLIVFATLSLYFVPWTFFSLLWIFFPFWYLVWTFSWTLELFFPWTMFPNFPRTFF